MIYIGIDNGLGGALVAISDQPGLAPIAKIPMPTRGKTSGNEVDALAVYEWLLSLHTAFDRMTAVIETPGKFAQGVQAISSMWDSYGAIRGVLECRGVRHHRITPQKWQKTILAGCKKGDTKPAALAKARQLWPAETWLRSPKCIKPHDGMIDAALIAEYARIKNL